MSEPLPHVRNRIRACREKRLTTLDLSFTDLWEIPDEVYELEHVEVLDVRGNHLKVIPDAVRRLPNLRLLDLRWNAFLQAVPDRPGLVLDFDFYERHRTSIAREHIAGFRCRHRTELEAVRGFSELQVLDLRYNKLTELPEWLSQLHNLTSLDVRSNQLTKLPEWLSQLHNLTSLDVGFNQLTELPEWLSQLHNLTSLDVGFNQLGALPEWLSQLHNLTSLDVSGNPLERPPLEVAEEGIDAIRAYYQQLAEEGQDRIYEAKLIIVGEPGAGKTTLAKKIEDPAYQLRDDEASTEGIDVITWTFPMANGEPFRVNIWDFGGQEIYHATHQFFLTKRSLYALVADSRKEDTDFHYWLNAVELFSDDSPVLIVKNEKQDRQRQIGEPQLRGRFLNLKQVLATNLSTPHGLPEILAHIKHHISTLPHVGTPLPKTWVNVRTALEADPRNHIRLDEYLALCKEHEFSKREDALQLSGYLHDLGVCLHFQDDPLLKQTVILKPEWGTAAVYMVLDSQTVRDNLGHFTRADLVKIWHQEHYAGMRDELLHLMIKFKLCYEIPDAPGTYIAPQLLTENQPDYEWDKRDNLLLRYTYEFMPKGLLTRFIVALHQWIEAQRLVWKTGVLLKRDRARAEVIEHYSRREIHVRVAGPRRRDLMTVVMHEFEKIHTSFHRLKYHTLIPCNCATCKPLAEPHFYPFDVLQRFAADGKDIQCQKSYEMVSPRSLLDDVAPRATLFSGEIPVYELTPVEHRKRGHRGEPERPLPDLPPSREVYLSYAWGGESEAIADALDQAFQDRGITIVRDKRDLGFKGRIKAFMEQIGRGKGIVVVISEKYLKSENCMFELVQIAQNGSFYDRVFPIVLDDARIYKPVQRLRYVKHWEEQIAELDAAMKDVNAANLQGFREDIDLYTQIRNTIARLTDTLRDMNTLTTEIHQDSGFEALVEAVTRKLKAE